MTAQFPNYLRTYRKRSGLTQEELASLFGFQTGQIVSRYESSIREPNLRTLFALQIVFGVPTEQLFPGIYSEVAAATTRRIEKLKKSISKQTQSPRKQRKLGVLAGIENYSSNHSII